MKKTDYLQRYEAVMKRLNTGDLLGLPEEIKDILRNTTDLKIKVEILEEIEKAL